MDEQLPHLEYLQRRFQQIAGGVQGGLARLGEPWGDDEPGRQFYEQYGRPAKMLIRSTKDMGDVVESMHDGISTLSTGLKNTEDLNSHNSQQLYRGTSGDARNADGGTRRH
ncbi:hypothetical protein PV350_46405 [Streptomyces sp. PA03-6a]|nr:hypothetical protein [Streptomyces sp. PA03-6a]